MNSELAVAHYEDIAPRSARILRACLSKRLDRIVWHDIPGDDGYGQIFETLELRFASRSIFLRTPHKERIDGRIDDVEFASEALSIDHNVADYTMVTDEDHPEWRTVVGHTLQAIDLLLDLKDSRFARYYGIRCRFNNGHTLGYHYQCGKQLGDPIPRNIALKVDGSEPPSELGWLFVDWLTSSE